MGISQVTGHLPFLRRRPLGRIEAARNARGPPDTVTPPYIAAVAWRNIDRRLARTIRPDVAAIGPGIIMQLNIGAEIGLYRSTLPCIVIVIGPDKSIAVLRPGIISPFDDQQIRCLPAYFIGALLKGQLLVAPDDIYDGVPRRQIGSAGRQM